VNFGVNDQHPEENWGEPGSIGNMDPAGQLVVSVRITCSRALSATPFPWDLPAIRAVKVEDDIVFALDSVPGTYTSLAEMNEEMWEEVSKFTPKEDCSDVMLLIIETLIFK